jgi:hypothetical protein
MNRFFVHVLVLVFFLFPISSALSENSSYQIVTYRLKEGKIKEIRDDFTQADKIYADFFFLPEGRETSVEFRWINPLNKKEQVFSKLVRSSMPAQKQSVLCWLEMYPSLSDKIIGSRFFGRWLLEVWVNNRCVAEKAFDVGN